MAEIIKPEELAQIDLNPPASSWMDTPVKLIKGTFNYPANKESEKYLDLPNSHDWDPRKDDWDLPAG